MGAEEMLTRLFFPDSPMWVLVTLCGFALVAFGYWWEWRSAKPLRGSHVFGQVARVYSRGKRRHRNGSKKAQIFV